MNFWLWRILLVWFLKNKNCLTKRIFILDVWYNKKEVLYLGRRLDWSKLLGELISSDVVAVIELVKNSYDADASIITITFDGTIEDVEVEPKIQKALKGRRL